MTNENTGDFTLNIGCLHLFQKCGNFGIKSNKKVFLRKIHSKLWTCSKGVYHLEDIDRFEWPLNKDRCLLFYKQKANRPTKMAFTTYT